MGLGYHFDICDSIELCIVELTRAACTCGQPYKAKTNMCVSGFSSEKVRYGQSALSFYFIKIFYIEIVFFTIFSTIFSIFDNILLTIHNKMFRVGTKTQVWSGNLKHTYFFFFASSLGGHKVMQEANSINLIA